MADKELPYEFQLEEIAVRINQFRDNDISPEVYLSTTFPKYFPVVMEPGVLTDVRWNDVTGLFMWSPILPVTYINCNILLAMSQQRIWEAKSNNLFYPRCSLAVVKLFPSAPVYGLSMIYVPATQARLHFLTAVAGLHQLDMEAVVLMYVPKTCIFIARAQQW